MVRRSFFHLIPFIRGVQFKSCLINTTDFRSTRYFINFIIIYFINSKTWSKRKSLHNKLCTSMDPPPVICVFPWLLRHNVFCQWRTSFKPLDWFLYSEELMYVVWNVFNELITVSLIKIILFDQIASAFHTIIIEHKETNYQKFIRKKH